MTNDDFTLQLVVPKTPSQTFAAIRDVRAWWGAGIEGDATRVGDVFTYRHDDLHRSTQALIELVPDEKLVWRVTQAHLSFVEPSNEWVGTHLVFALAGVGEQTRVSFAHEGLRPSVACFDACSKGWRYYVGESLRKLLETGVGTPDAPTKGRAR